MEGGTTGTSPTGSFQLVGLARSATGDPIHDTDMTVRSTKGDTALAAARTDTQGRFAMILPPTTASLTVTVGEKISAPLPRFLPGSSILSTELVENEAGFLADRHTFEVQVAESLLCPALRLDGNTLYRQEELSSGTTCLVPFTVASSTLSASRFKATISNGCGSTPPITVQPDGSGTLAVDVGPFIRADCDSFSVVVSHDDANQPGAGFTVYG